MIKQIRTMDYFKHINLKKVYCLGASLFGLKLLKDASETLQQLENLEIKKDIIDEHCVYYPVKQLNFRRNDEEKELVITPLDADNYRVNISALKEYYSLDELEIEDIHRMSTTQIIGTPMIRFQTSMKDGKRTLLWDKNHKGVLMNKENRISEKEKDQIIKTKLASASTKIAFGGAILFSTLMIVLE